MATWGLLSSKLVERALAASSGCGSLKDIEHIVILIQENRSFDHYFGTYKGVAGFQDPNALPGVFGQAGYPTVTSKLYPFHLDTQNGADCTNDIDHSWGPQHTYWDGGSMDEWVSEHVAVDGPQNGPLCMGYYTRADLPFYYALADAFTLCDHYHCSVIGPTDPNRCYTMSASIDPNGTAGGPIVSTLGSTRLQTYGKFTWTTMPEVLQDAGITWKVYESPENLSPVSDNVLPYFKAYQQNPQLAANAFGQTYPAQFLADCAAGTLPQVSWVIAPVTMSEHPPAPVTHGEVVTAQVLNALVSNQSLWEKTALLVTYDENGGFFDHLPPPTAPAGTAGEFVTTGLVPATDPIGLGFRVPMLVLSPFSRGGFVYSGTLDHVSTLKLLAARFGVTVPNLIPGGWRDTTVGDVTGAFNFASVDASLPSLPSPSATDLRVVGQESCQTGLISAANEGSAPTHYPIDSSNTAPPPQEPGTATAPSGPVACAN
ncbi:MAG TPA: alkaline phosphatase family protein [Solirubrobacteraceae bacterium]|nr:alkaline phosphatase family protein [Solirubrobacteraceae bacterium]